MDGPRPCPRPGGTALNLTLVCLCALVLASQAPAATKPDRPSKPTKAKTQPSAPPTLEQRLAKKERAARKCRTTIRFFQNHRWLLRKGEDRLDARAALRRAERRLARLERTIRTLRRLIARRDARREARLAPRVVICEVFGRYCDQAVAVAWCESRHSTRARNGQYLGLFQMGYWERQRFGHGRTARQQALAAYRYFVRSGRDWGPWSCKPWFAY